MIFTDPNLTEVISVLKNNQELMAYLKKSQFLLSRQMLYGSVPTQDIINGDFDTSIAIDNNETIESLATTLLKYKDVIKSNEIWYLCSNKIGYAEIAGDLSIPEKDLPMETYKQIMYTYKYCYVSSFFQNNKKTFIPANDYLEIEQNDYLSAYLDALAKEFDKIDSILTSSKNYQNFDKIPFEYINYLTQLLGFEKATINATEEIELKYRELVKNIIDIYRIKGNNYSFELFFKFLGYNIIIKDFFFDRRLYYSNSNSNEDTSSMDKASYLFYLTTKKPEDNALDVSTAEYVDFKDYTPQYSMNEFNELANEYGEEAVLGYSLVDKNGEEYTGKIYKYFKTNVVYYTISLEEQNPTQKQLNQINKILSFLTPAYILRSTNVSAVSSLNEQKPSENTIFFDDNRTKNITNGEKTLIENLEAKYGEDFDKVLEDVREYPIMLDAEKRNDDTADSEESATLDREKSLYVIGDENTTGFSVLHDNTAYNGSASGDVKERYDGETDYLNTIGTKTYKPKIPEEIVVRLSLNNAYDFEENNPSNFISIKEQNKVLNLSKEISLTDLSIDDYLKENNSLSYCNSLFWVLNKEKVYDLSILDSLSTEGEFAIENYKIRKYTTTTEDLRKAGDNDLSACLNPFNFFDEDFCFTLNSGDCVALNDGYFVYIYRYEITPKNNSNYNQSFKIFLKPYKEMYRTRNKLMYLNVSDENRVVGNNLEELYTNINAVEVSQKSSLLKKFYFSKEENIWYHPLKKAPTFSYNVNGRNYVINADLGFTKEDSHKIPIINFDGEKYSFGNYTTDSLDALVSSNVFKEFYKPKCYFYVNDIRDSNASQNYRLDYTNNNFYVYSTKDEMLYFVNNNIPTRIEHFFGKLVVSDGKAEIFAYDDDWKGYSEIDDEASFIFYNSPHYINWDYLNIHQEIGRPIRYETDKLFENYKDNVLKEIVYSTVPFFTAKTKRDFLTSLGILVYSDAEDMVGNRLVSTEALISVLDGSIKENHYNCVYSLGAGISYLENIAATLLNEQDKPVLKDSDAYGNVNNILCPILNILKAYEAGNGEEYLKDYFYNKLLALYRESFISESTNEERENTVLDSLDYKVYETLNGRAGRISKPNTLRQSRKGIKAYKLPYRVYSNSTIRADYDPSFKDSKSIKNVVLRYSYKSVFVKDVTFSLVPPVVSTGEKGYIQITGEFPADLKDGTVVINNTLQKLRNNRFNYQNSDLLEEDEFNSRGDDRKLEVKVETNLDCFVEKENNNYIIEVDSVFPQNADRLTLSYSNDKIDVNLPNGFITTIISDLNPQAVSYKSVDFNNLTIKASFSMIGVNLIKS